MEIFKLFGSIFVDNEKANESISSTEKKAEGLGGKLLKGVGTAAKWGAGIAAGAGVAIGGMLKLAEKTAASADVIDKLSERTGVNREELQRWKYAADQSGADVTKFEVGVKKLSAAMDGASNGSKLNVEAFGALGISMEQVKNSSPSEMLDTVMKQLADMPDSAQRNALGNQLLGKSYQDMLPLLNAGSEGIEALKSRADDLGLVMSEDMVKANVKFGDTLADVKASFSAVFMHISNEMLPLLQTVLDFILSQMPTIQSVLSVVFDVVGKGVSTVIEVVKAVTQIFASFFEGTGESGKEFQEGMKSISENVKSVLNALKEFIDIILKVIKDIWGKHGEEIKAVVSVIFDQIKTVIEAALKIIEGIIDVFSGILTGDWEKVWEGIKKIVSAAFEAIGKLFMDAVAGVGKIFEDLGNFFLNAGQNIMNSLLDGLKAVWKSISNWFSDKINWIKDKLTFWEDSKSKMSSDSSDVSTSRVNGSHAKGLNYVPFDGYIAELHKGERVLTAEENKNISTANSGGKDYSAAFSKMIDLLKNLVSETKDQPRKQRDLMRKGEVQFG